MGGEIREKKKGEVDGEEKGKVMDRKIVKEMIVEEMEKGRINGEEGIVKID